MVRYKITETQFNLLKEYTRYAGKMVFENDDDDEFDPLKHYSNTVTTPEGITNSCLLTFSKENAKISHPYFSLPAGYRAYV